LAFRGDDRALVGGVLRGHPGAAAAFHDRFALKMHGLLFRLMGPDPELEDVLQDAFVRTLEALPRLRDVVALEGFVMGVTVRTARTWLQRRSRRRWLRLVPAEELPEPIAPACEPAVRQALQAVYGALQSLPVDERIALVLRLAVGMTLPEAAEACHVSLSTIKRRLARAERAFMDQARQRPVLAEWLSGGAQ